MCYNPLGFYNIQCTFNTNLKDIDRMDIPFDILEDVSDDYKFYVQVEQGTTIDRAPI